MLTLKSSVGRRYSEVRKKQFFNETLHCSHETMLTTTLKNRNQPCTATDTFLLLCATDDSDEVKRHLEKGFDVDSSNSIGKTGLFAAVVGNKIDVVNILLVHDAHIFHKDNDGNTCLHFAKNDVILNTICNQINLKHLDEREVVNAYNINGITPLHEAALHGPQRRLEILLEHGANPNAQDTTGSTPLHYLMQSSTRTFQGIKALITSGSDVNKLNKFMKTPWNVGFSYYMDEDILMLLLDHGINPAIQDMDGNTLLHLYLKNYSLFSIFKPTIDMTRTIIGRCPQLLNALNVYGQNPVLLGFLYDLEEDVALKIIQEFDLDLFETDSFGRNILHLGCQLGFSQLASYLVQTIPDLLKQTDRLGRIPLCYACHHGTSELIEVMLLALDKDRDSIKMDNFGLLPMDYISNTTTDKIRELLNKFNYAVSQNTPRGNDQVNFKPEDNILQAMEVNCCENVLPEDLRPQKDANHFIQQLCQDSNISFSCKPERHEIDNRFIEKFVRDLLSGVSELDPRFRGELICSGSAYEGVRTGEGDFDYMFSLEYISKITIVTESIDDPPGYTKVKVNVPRCDLKDYGDFFTDDNYLDCRRLMTVFSSVVYKALYNPALWRDNNLDFFPALRLQWKNRPALTIVCVLRQGKKLASQISIDIVPTIKPLHWLPKDCNKDTTGYLWDVIEQSGCHLVIKTIKVPYYQHFGISMPHLYLRISFSKVSTVIFNECEESVRTSLILAKLLSKRMAKVPLSWITGSDDNKLQKGRILSQNLIKSFFLKQCLLNILKEKGHTKHYDVLILLKDIFSTYWKFVITHNMPSAYISQQNLLKTFLPDPMTSMTSFFLQLTVISLEEGGATYNVDRTDYGRAKTCNDDEVYMDKRMRNLNNNLLGPNEI